MTTSNHAFDVVIVGAGIAGSALAISLARAGYGVLMLEKSKVHVDRVRGELIVPWGVAEARALGILDLLEGAGGNYVVGSIPYSDRHRAEGCAACFESAWRQQGLVAACVCGLRRAALLTNEPAALQRAAARDLSHGVHRGGPRAPPPRPRAYGRRSRTRVALCGHAEGTVRRAARSVRAGCVGSARGLAAN